jgi:cell division septum initiation protein DivIVA
VAVAERHAVDGRPTGDDSPGGQAEGWPRQVRELLLHANEQATSLRAERRALVARVAELEKTVDAAKASTRRLRARIAELEKAATPSPSPTRPSDGQWLATVADRTAHALRSGHEAAQSLVERARHRCVEIEQAALHEAADIRRRADAEAQKILTVAQYDAEGLLQGAQASGEELLAHARQLRDRAIAQFAERRAALQQEIDQLEARRITLLETYAAIKSSVDEAIRALEGQPRGPSPRTRARAFVEWLRDPEPGDAVNASAR